ncbi:protein-L-isoaspartate O-methyltransferase [Candidatus Woesearchaeota archaeon CG10_big_fil_rev_8_21_14_0_10_36_11]|nr:MAG: protein-L-isoaspartate O-methyltransferase [Candidatus Woesearchaeota archaeon CG10_big_fil_rev_8_21_14_0_10_36_11]
MISIMPTKEDLIRFWKEKNIVTNPILFGAFEAIPREAFIAPTLHHLAYEDRPLPTIRKQSISQPTTIMLMLEALELRKGHNVFELGAGVGYQAALLSKAVGPQGKCTTVDIIPELINATKENFLKLNILNAHVIETDGGDGYNENAPYDRIIITAACPSIPQPLIDQLKEGGILVAPVGNLQSQTMVKGVKENGRLDLDFIGQFAFVPLRGKYGFKELENMQE